MDFLIFSIAFWYISYELESYCHLIAANVGVYAVRGMGGLKNEAQRNVKPDLLRTVPHTETKLRN